MAADREAKIAYTKELLADGTSRVPDIQKAVKAKFGAGVSFRDLAGLFPNKPKPKDRKTRRPGRPRKAQSTAAAPKAVGVKKKGGRTKVWSSNQWVLLVNGGAEVFGGKRALESRVANLIAAGHCVDRLAVYEKASMQMTLMTTVTL
jgi:hypothetical protein